MTSKADALLHPVRLRVVRAVAARCPVSAKELGAVLKDVPHATLYRHVRTLADAGWLSVDSERQARGATEVRYVLAGEDAVATKADLAGASLEDHRRWFSVFTLSLAGAFERYTELEGADPLEDGVRYRQIPLRLTEEERHAFNDELHALVEKYRARDQGRGRLFATALFPDVDLDANGSRDDPNADEPSADPDEL